MKNPAVIFLYLYLIACALIEETISWFNRHIKGDQAYTVRKPVNNTP